MIILDTDILIDFFRGHAACRAWLSAVGNVAVGIPVIVEMELFAGCRDKREEQWVGQQLQKYQKLWLDETAVQNIVLRFPAAHLSHGTGILDALIAATALHHKERLYTFNVKHFAAFAELVTVQPYVR